MNGKGSEKKEEKGMLTSRSLGSAREGKRRSRKRERINLRSFGKEPEGESRERSLFIQQTKVKTENSCEPLK